MHYLLFNPLSKSGSNPKYIKKAERDFQKLGFETHTKDLIEVSKDVKGFAERLTPEDVVVLIGGDGTLHHFSDAIKDIKKDNKIMLYKGGTGNDFSREFKGHIIDISEPIRDVPSFNNNGIDHTFVNGVGFGIDGEVCRVVNASDTSRKGLNYYKSAIKLFTGFKQYDLDVLIDGVEYHFKKVWFATVMNGKHFGGGMKLSPNSDRKDDIMELCMVHSVPLGKLLLVFPLIFIGKHMWFKHLGIECIKGHEFKLVASTPQTLQADGEVTLEVKEFTCKR